MAQIQRRKHSRDSVSQEFRSAELGSRFLFVSGTGVVAVGDNPGSGLLAQTFLLTFLTGSHFND